MTYTQEPQKIPTTSDYVPRIADGELKELSSGLPAIVIDGAKGVGKTRTASRLAATTYSLMEHGVVEVLASDPEAVQDGTPPVLIDEWQRLPWIWDQVKTWVDQDPAPGRFLLTGSAIPQGTSLHSGAGRIVRLMMRPLSLAERGLAQPQVSLEQLLKGQVDQVRGTCEVRLADYVQEIVGSGFPGIRPLPERVREAALDGYLAAIVEREFPEQGLTVRKPHVLTSWLRAYAAATASTATYSTILRAASPGQSDQPASSTVLAYRDVLASLWMSDLVPAWSPAFTGLRNLGKAPKHFLADPALAARLLHLSTSALLRGETKVAPLGPQAGTLLGRLFESLVALSLQTYAAAARASMSHLRTQRGEHEVDFVLERDFRVLGIEVKLSASVEDRDVGHLRWLASQWPADDLTLVVLTTGREAYTRRDGIHVIPAALLGP